MNFKKSTYLSVRSNSGVGVEIRCQDEKASGNGLALRFHKNAVVATALYSKTGIPMLPSYLMATACRVRACGDGDCVGKRSGKGEQTTKMLYRVRF